jgi:hypothetical protein
MSKTLRNKPFPKILETNKYIIVLGLREIFQLPNFFNILNFEKDEIPRNKIFDIK